MGRDLAHEYPIARRTYHEADDVLGFALSRLCFDGPEHELQLTKHAQPAILVTSIAVFRVLVEHGLTFDGRSPESPVGVGSDPAGSAGGAGGNAPRGVDVVAGHSLGEWSALVAAGALGLRDAVRLTQLRGTYMQDAVPVGQGAMAALIGLDLAAVTAVCETASRPGEPVEIANINGASQIVISGNTTAVDRAVLEAKAAGAKRAVRLAVSAPFHCSLMKPAAAQLAAQLAGVAITAPSVPVVANVTARPTQDAAEIKDLLIQQVSAPVRWEQSIQTIAALGVTRAYELGSGSVLKGLVKRIAETIETTAIGEPHEVKAFTPTPGSLHGHH